MNTGGYLRVSFVILAITFLTACINTADMVLINNSNETIYGTLQRNWDGKEQGTSKKE